MKNKETRVFFVVTSENTNAELFETLQQAREYMKQIDAQEKPIITVALVNNTYYDSELKTWNYEDYSDTFEQEFIL